MLHCEGDYAAMQTNQLPLASGIPILRTALLTAARKMTMSKTASLPLSPSTTVFGRLLALIDHVLMTNARIANRNGDLPYFGL
jgi:hypothetical protein